jgi:hypothetical protein
MHHEPPDTTGVSWVDALDSAGALLALGADSCAGAASCTGAASCAGADSCAGAAACAPEDSPVEGVLSCAGFEPDCPEPEALDCPPCDA